MNLNNTLLRRLGRALVLVGFCFFLPDAFASSSLHFIHADDFHDYLTINQTTTDSGTSLQADVGPISVSGGVTNVSTLQQPISLGFSPGSIPSVNFPVGTYVPATTTCQQDSSSSSYSTWTSGLPTVTGSTTPTYTTNCVTVPAHLDMQLAEDAANQWASMQSVGTVTAPASYDSYGNYVPPTVSPDTGNSGAAANLKAFISGVAGVLQKYGLNQATVSYSQTTSLSAQPSQASQTVQTICTGWDSSADSKTWGGFPTCSQSTQQQTTVDTSAASNPSMTLTVFFQFTLDQNGNVRAIAPVVKQPSGTTLKVTYTPLNLSDNLPSDWSYPNAGTIGYQLLDSTGTALTGTQYVNVSGAYDATAMSQDTNLALCFLGPNLGTGCPSAPTVASLMSSTGASSALVTYYYEIGAKYSAGPGGTSIPDILIAEDSRNFTCSAASSSATQCAMSCTSYNNAGIFGAVLEEDALQYEVTGLSNSGTPSYTALGSLHQNVVSPIESFSKSAPITSDGTDQMSYDPQLVTPLPLTSLTLSDISAYPPSVLSYVAPLQTSSVTTTPVTGPVQVGTDSSGKPIYKTQQTGVTCTVVQTPASSIPSQGTPSGLESALGAM